jgi:hypothetical protein
MMMQNRAKAAVQVKQGDKRRELPHAFFSWLLDSGSWLL